MQTFDHLHFFQSATRNTAVALPFALEKFVEDWSRLRSRMIREMPSAFSRDEWAYLVTFLSPENLLSPFEQSFGKSAAVQSAVSNSLARPRGPVAVWLPSNVSLLGPLMLVLLSLTGNPIRLKGGTEAEDLTGVFLKFARDHVSPGPLQTYLAEQVQHDVFTRNDPRNLEMAKLAQIRIVFGSDAAAEAIHSMPRPVESAGYSFVDRRSEAWIEGSCASDGVLRNLLKVFAIYGQTGCTSPRRVILLGASIREAVSVRDRLLDLWPETITRPPAMHVASSNIMGSQWAAALGWDAKLAARHGAVFASGEISLPEFSAPMGLMIVPATLEETMAVLPRNIQTIGHAFANPADPAWLRVIAHTRIKRLVPIAAMHHFGPVWDGQAFWRECFEETPLY